MSSMGNQVRLGVRLGVSLAGLSSLFMVATPCEAVVISEIHYHPPVGDEALEFVELTNDLATPEDISGYAFQSGIDIVIPDGTVLGPYGSLVIAKDAATLAARYGISNVIGDFAGKLDGAGERLELVNHAGAVVQSVRYQDSGKWPSGPDGTGHTLSLRSLRLDPGEPESWAHSLELGGTPGRWNFPSTTPTFEEDELIARGALWRYAKGTAPYSAAPADWRGVGFDDSGWLEGPSGFGYGDGDDATLLDDMPGAYASVAIRKTFSLTAQALANPGDWSLAIDYDDGFTAWLNGVEIARVNCGAPGEELPHDALASGPREAGAEESFGIAQGILAAGQNVLALVARNVDLSSSDLSLIPRLVRRRQLSGPAGSSIGVVFNELFRSNPPGTGWVELYNPSGSPLDLGTYRLTDDPRRTNPYSLPAPSVVPPRGFLVLDEATVGLALSAQIVRLILLADDGRVAAATVFDRSPPVGAAGGHSEARLPDGAGELWVSLTPTRALPNQVSRNTSVVLNEIFYHPPDERSGEFVELYNRGGSTVDLSGWRFTKGIDWSFPPGTTLAAGAYLVVSNDPALLESAHGISGVLGPYGGQLSNDGENIRLVDAWSNRVDEVRYHDGGDWSRWADGGGSSLELVDPRQDNDVASAWEPSDESPKSSWERHSFFVPSYVPTGASELHLYLAEAGTALVDDVAISRSGGANLIPNPGFEASTSPWVIEGTHIASRRINTEAHSGAACLEVNASAKGDTLVNRIEVDTSPAMTSGPYDVTLWTRWIRGASLLVAHGEFHAGVYGGRPSPATNLSGNSLSAGLRLTVPEDLGTPGAENSATRRLREATGAANLGPVASGVRHRPATPGPGEVARIEARISDADGVASAAVFYRLESAAGAFQSAPLLDDGLHADGDAGDGFFVGEIPGQALSSRVLFYLEATDGAGRQQRYPADAPTETLLYQAQNPAAPGLDTGRMILDAARSAELTGRQLHSNDLVSGTYVFNDDEVYYNVGVRYRGSPWGRPGRNNFRVRFPDDHPLPRGWTALNVDNSGGEAREAAAYFLVARAGTLSAPAPASDYAFINAYLNGSSIGRHGYLQPVDRVLLKKWYGDLDVPLALKAEGRRPFNDSGGLLAWDGCSFVYRGPDPESYRDYFIQGVKDSLDFWEPLFELTRVMDRTVTANAELDASIGGILDLESFFRVFAPRVLQQDWDAFTIGNGHNGYLVVDPRDGRFDLLPHDMDNTFGDPNSTLFPAADPDIARLLTRPLPRRIYFRALWEYIEHGYWSATRAAPYLDALQAATGAATGGIKSYLTSSVASKRPQIVGSTTIPLRITTNSGNPIATDASEVELVGDAPVQIVLFAAIRNGGEPEVFEPGWTTLTRWKATFALSEALTELELLGLDGDGNVSNTTSIEIASSAFSSVVGLTGLDPASGDAEGGTVVTLSGFGFEPGMSVRFGGLSAGEVEALSGETARVVTPPAARPLPPGGKVNVEVTTPGGERALRPAGFTYVEARFLRGDANGDGSVDLADAVAALLHLYGGIAVSCFDAADADDSGFLDITDPLVVLNYLFRSGVAPAAPFPTAGPDLTPDTLRCSQ